MGQFLYTNGDYNIKTADGGIIRLDTGPVNSGGSVVITGNIFIGGDTTTVNAEQLEIVDNIISLNVGETGAGINPSLRYSGIRVDRGTAISTSILYDENDDSWNIVNGSPEEGIDWESTKLRVSTILTDADGSDQGDLTLIGTGSGVVKVNGTIDYTTEILSRANIDDLNSTNFAEDILVNKGYVDFAIVNQPSFQITSDDSRVILTDAVGPDAAANLAYLGSLGLNSYGQSAVSFVLDDILAGQLFKTHLSISRIELGLPGQVGPFEITSTGTNDNIYIRTQGTGKLQTNVGIQLEQGSTDASPVSGSTILFAKDPDIGETGLYFRNDLTETYKNTGELVSKNRALLFSMIF